MSDYDAAGEFVQQAIDTYGKLDVLINVAGILRDKMIFNLSPEDWDAVIKVHLKGTFNTCKHASVYWRGLRDENAHNRIINFTSGSGMHGAPGQPNYAAAKYGIVGLTYSCAAALGQLRRHLQLHQPGREHPDGPIDPRPRRVAWRKTR